MAYDKTNKGVLFRNRNKNHDRSPDYIGEITLENGETRWLSAWLNDSDKCGKYLSISVGDIKASARSAPQDNDFDDDILF